MFSINSDHLSVEWAAGLASKYHWVWLRDSCDCASCLNNNAKQKYYDPSEIPLNIKPQSVEFDESTLTISWPDGHLSKYLKHWLIENDYSVLSENTKPSDNLKWQEWSSRKIVTDAYVDLPELSDTSKYREVLEYLFKYGMVILRTGSQTEAGFEKFCEVFAGFVDRSYFGNYFDLETKPVDATDSISFSAKALHLHTDIPYYTTPPDYQFLFGLNVLKQTNADTVGKTIFVDGFTVANKFKKANKQDFNTLSEVPVTYRAAYPWAEKIYQNKTEIIQLDRYGEVTRILNNPSKMFFEDIPYETMPKLYRAYQNFKNALKNASVIYEHEWQQGDVVVFDNRRIFHGRSAFENSNVTRTLRGGYFREVELLARLNYLITEDEQ